jgi:transposase InsO family protein
MGIRDRPISPASPWQNGIAERLIGTLRRAIPNFISAPETIAALRQNGTSPINWRRRFHPRATVGAANSSDLKQIVNYPRNIVRN